MIQILNKHGATNSDDANVIVLDKNGNVKKSGGTAPTINRCFGATFDGGGSVILENTTVDIIIPFNMVINEWTIVADVVGSVEIGVWKTTYADYPPTIVDSITGLEKPTISLSNKAQSSTLVGWTTLINSGDTVRFNIDSISVITNITLMIQGIQI